MSGALAAAAAALAGFAALVAAAAALGRALTAAVAGPAAWGSEEPGRGGRARLLLRGSAWGWACDAVGGLAALHLLMLLLDLAGVRWTRVSLPAAWLLALAAAAAVARRRRGLEAPPGIGPAGRLGGGDLLAAAVCALHAGLAWSLWIAIPDFVYHWGVKGRRYHLAGGIDRGFLADPLHLAQHPDYPNLLPDLYAAAAVIAGRFDARAMMLFSALALALLAAAAREPWRRLGTAAAGRQVGIVAVVAAAAAFGIGYRLAGGGDWNLALALVLALPPLMAPAAPDGAGGPYGGAATADDLRLGFAAAFAAGSKVEGVPLAAILVALHLARRARVGGPGWLLRSAPAAALPALLVIVPWLAANLRYGLFAANYPGGGVEPGRAAAVGAAVAEAFATREWHGLAWLLPPLVVALALSRRTRPVALAVALQLAVYLWVYLASPLEPRFYVLSSFPRLLFHLLPATLVAAVAVVSYGSSSKP